MDRDLRVPRQRYSEREKEADTPWFTQKTNKVLDTGLASLTKAPGALSRWVKAQGDFSRESQKSGQESEQDGLCAPRNQSRRVGEREREREKDTGTQALMEQRCFNDFSVSIQAVVQEVSFINDKHQKTKRIVIVTKGTRDDDGQKVRRQSISQERGSRLSSFVIKRMFTKGDSSLSHTMTPVPGSSVLFCLKRNKGLVRNSTQKSSC